MQDIVIDLCCCPVQLHFCEVPLLAHFHWFFVRANILKTRVGGIKFWYVSTPFLRKYPLKPPLSLFWWLLHRRSKLIHLLPTRQATCRNFLAFSKYLLKKIGSLNVPPIFSLILRTFVSGKVLFCRYNNSVVDNFFLAHGSTLFSCILPAYRV